VQSEADHCSFRCAAGWKKLLAKNALRHTGRLISHVRPLSVASMPPINLRIGARGSDEACLSVRIVAKLTPNLWGAFAMTILGSTEDEVRKAMQRFDLEMRDTKDWLRWEENKTHKFAFLSDGRRYPMKQIISMATGTPIMILVGARKLSGSPQSWGLRWRPSVSPQRRKPE
jgi:hypothetical protein